MELAQLLENLTGGDDPARVSPAQMHPVRQALLERISSYRDHAAVMGLDGLFTKYGPNFSVARMLLNAGEFPRLDEDRDWFSLLTPRSQERIGGAGAFNQDFSSWMRQVNSFVEDAKLLATFTELADGYAAITAEVNAAAGNGEVISNLIEMAGAPDAELRIIPSPLISPGRNYCTSFRDSDGRLCIIYFFGPYKQVPAGMFRCQSWAEVPITFNDREQFLQFGLHEVLHGLVGASSGAQIAAEAQHAQPVLEALEPVLARSYGALPDAASKYLDEVIVRALTLEALRLHVGEPVFRLAAEQEWLATNGVAPLVWRGIAQSGSRASSGVGGAVAGALEALVSSTPEELAALRTYNNHSLTLDAFFREFVPEHCDPGSIALEVDARLGAQWEADFAAALTERLAFPTTVPTDEASVEAPFQLHVKLNDEAESAPALRELGLQLDGGEVVTTDGRCFPRTGSFVVSLRPNGRNGGLDVIWDLLDASLQPAEVVPFYFIHITHVFVHGGYPAVMDTRTQETLRLAGWLHQLSAPD